MIQMKGITNVDTRTFNVLSLCSGVGQLDIGVKLAVPVARTICYVEIEAFPCEILVSRMEDGNLDEAPVWSDLRTFDGKPWRGKVDCIIGGYPCQPFSVAGKMGGSDDPRHLWPAIARIVREVEPAWCFFENVRNHINIGFEEVRDELQGMGYDVEAGIYSAEEVGAPHKRDRLFIMAHTRQRWGRWNVRPEQTTTRIKSKNETKGSSGELGNNNTGLERWGVSGCECSYQRSTWPPSPEDTDQWREVLEFDKTVEPSIFRMVDGMDTRLDTSPFAYRKDRLQSVGNGVVPLTAAFAFVSLLRKFK